MKEGLMTVGLLKDWLTLRLRLARLECSVAHHDQGAQRAAYRGDLCAWLDHLEYQAHYLTEKISLQCDSFAQSMDDREELASLLTIIQSIEPRTSPDAHRFNAKLGALRAAYGPLARRPEPPYGLLAH
jgi:hypothetical protein